MPIILLLSVVLVLTGCASTPYSQTHAEAPAQRSLSTSTDETWPERAIRRDIPMLNMIRNAHRAGTRDSTGRPGSRYWQLKTDYTMSVRLDPATNTLTGRAQIVVQNASESSLKDLVFRLDHNFFRTSLPTVPRGGSRPAEATDGMVITQIRIRGQDIDLKRVSGLDQTIARLMLPTPIESKASETVEIAWQTKLPGGPAGSGHRMTMRWADTLYQPTQWYPRLAKYDDLRGWETDPYLGPSEFYNNFGRFDVRIDVPAGWLVSSTGVLQNPQEVLTATARERLAKALTTDELVTIVGADESGPGRATAAGDRLIWHYVADTVNDFAWATAKAFVWQSTRAMIPGKGAIPIHMFYLPGRASQYSQAASITRHALEFYSRLLVPYPFPQFTLQDGPSNGMEYPMVINSNQGAADHETAHQWWPMMVGVNETRFGWMDEGFNQYVNVLSDADTKKSSPNLKGMGQSYGNTSGNESEPSLMWNSNYAGPMYSFQAYGKTPLMFAMLGGIVGDSAVARAISAYTNTWRFKHPSPWDFMFFMNAELKQDLGWFWYYWLFTTESVDGSIHTVTSNGSRTMVTVRQDGAMPSPVVLKVQFAPTGPAIRSIPNSRLLDSVTAIVTYPADVWFSGRRTYTASLDFGGRTIERITLDPEGRFPDRNPSDNVWPRSSAPPGGR